MQQRKSGSLYRQSFDSLYEMARWIERTPCTGKWARDPMSTEYGARMGWDLKAGYDGAWRMAKEGWNEGAQRTQKALKALPAATPQPVERVDFYGHRPHVARFCAGAPDSMIRHDKAETGAGKVLTLYVAINALADVNAENMANYGLAIAHYVNQLEANSTRVELHAACCSVMYNKIALAHTVRVKSADQPLDLAVASFAIGHPAMFRRLMFALRERSGAPKSGYGSSRDLILTDIINPPAGATIINGMRHADSIARTPEQALEYVTKQLEGE